MAYLNESYCVYWCDRYLSKDPLIGVVSLIDKRPLARPEGLRVSGVMWVLILTVGSSPSGSSAGYVEKWPSSPESESESGTRDLPQRDADRTPSTHCKISIPISRTFRFLNLQEKGSGTLVWFELLSESDLEFGIDALFVSSGWRMFPGRAASSRGLDGKSKGSMCLESSNSPSAWGGRTGSQADLSSDLSNNISILCWAEDASWEGVIEGTWLEMLAVSFNKEDILSSRSRSRSTIYKNVSFMYPRKCVRKNLFS